MNSHRNSFPLLFYFLLAALEGVVCLVFTQAIPGDEKNSYLLGYSLPRILLILIILMLIFVFCGLSWRVRRDRKWGEEFVRGILIQDHWRVTIVWASKLALVSGLLLLVLPGSWVEGYQAYIVRLKPLVVWIGMLGMQTLILTFLYSRCSQKRDIETVPGVKPPLWVNKCKWVKAFLSIFLFLGVLVLPSGVEAWFNGLPWSQPIEFIAMAAVLPFLLLLDWNFLSRYAVIIAFCVLLALKIGLALIAPHSGWAMQVYASPAAMAEKRWELTYTSMLNPGLSEIYDHPLRSRLEFPIEWKTVYGYEKEKPWLGLEINGFVRLPVNAKLVWIATGLEDGGAIAFTKSGDEIVVPIVDNYHAATLAKSETLPGGVQRVHAEMVFGEGNWSLEAVFVYPDGTLQSLDGRGVMWQTDQAAEIAWIKLALVQLAAHMVDLGIIIFLLAWLLLGLRSRIIRHELDHAIIYIAIAGCWLPGLLKSIFPSANMDALLGVDILVVGGLLVIWNYVKVRTDEPGNLERRSLPKIALVIFGSLLLFHFSMKLASEVGRIWIYTTGSDPLTYQVFGRQIFVEGDFWNKADAVYAYQPLYRYIVGFLHYLFGQSSAAQNMLDVWSVIGAGMVMVSLGTWLGVSAGFSVAGACLYLALGWITPFNRLLGVGMQEYCAMLFVMLTAWAAGQRSFWGWKKIFLVSLFGVCGLLLRNDHLGVLGAAVLLTIEPLHGSTRQVWKTFFARLLKEWKLVIVPGMVILGGLLFQAVRNYIIGGMFVVNQTQNTTSGWYHSLGERVSGVLMVLNSGLSADFSSPGIVFIAVILWLGVLFGAISLVWRKGALVHYNLCLGIMLVGLLAPYLFFRPTATPPRWSVHLLPLAVFSLTLMTSRIFQPSNNGQNQE